MNLKEKIEEDLKRALKERKEREVSVLKLLKDAIFLKEKEKRYKIFSQKGEIGEKELEKESQLSDEEIIEVLFSEIKKRKEAIFEFEKGKREDLVKKEKEELEILKKYLPQQLSPEDIKNLAKEIIEKVGPNFGAVMKEIMSKVKGRAEGATVSKIVKELISKK
jgi:uncharacterized protein YqeY